MASVLDLQGIGGAPSPALQAWSTISGGHCGKKGWSLLSVVDCGNNIIGPAR
jgi:hypothetical protein